MADDEIEHDVAETERALRYKRKGGSPVKRALTIAALLLSTLTAHAVESNPKHVFIHTDPSCNGQLGSQIMSSFREAIRASAGYQIATNMRDDGGYGLVITVYVVCSETTLPANRERIISMASIFGTGVCLGPSDCHVTSNEAGLQTQLCSGSSGRACGADLLTGLDQYMSQDGGSIFDSLSKEKVAGH
jgi:hypothetical protein